MIIQVTNVDETSSTEIINKRLDCKDAENEDNSILRHILMGHGNRNQKGFNKDKNAAVVNPTVGDKYMKISEEQIIFDDVLKSKVEIIFDDVLESEEEIIFDDVKEESKEESIFDEDVPELKENAQAAVAKSLQSIEIIEKTVLSLQPSKENCSIPNSTGRKKIIKCTICDLYFLGHQHLLLHYHKKHGTSQAYVCSPCHISFMKKEEIEKHLLNHQNDIHSQKLEEIQEDSITTYNCQFCHAVFETANLLSNHHRRCRKRPIHYKCSDCNLWYKTFASYNRHLLSHSDTDNIIKCAHCQATFQSEYWYEKHVESYSVDGILQCSTKKKHCMPGLCYVCGKYVMNLQSHLLHHNSIKQCVCEVCGIFTVKKNFWHHMQTHIKKSYLCDICGKMYSQPHHFRSHTMNHKGIKPYGCSVCGKKFLNKTALNQHNLVHTGLRNYHCKQCNRSFMNRSNLNRHSRIHSGVKTFQCNICNQLFSRSEPLKEHQKRVHHILDQHPVVRI